MTDQPATPTPQEDDRDYVTRRRAERATNDTGPVPPRALEGFEPSGHLAAAIARLAADPVAAAAAHEAIVATDQQIATEAAAERRRIRWDAYQRTRPPMFAAATYNDLTPADKARAKALGWWDSTAKNLVIAGEPGRGKTHAGYAICNEVAAADRDGLYTKPVVVRAHSIAGLRELLTPAAVHAARDEVTSRARERALYEARTCDLLLLDDLTAANVTDWFRSEVHDLIDARVTANRRTIVTVNAATRETFTQTMLDRLGAAIVSRLNDQAVYVWLEGADRRLASTWDPFA